MYCTVVHLIGAPCIVNLKKIVYITPVLVQLKGAYHCFLYIYTEPEHVTVDGVYY